MFSTTSSGSWDNTLKFLGNLKSNHILQVLEKFGPVGVAALASATPKETGETAHSWKYEISQGKRGYTLSWFNTHEEDGVNIAVIIQYGHGTGTGGYVQGVDYINPAMRPVFDKIVEDIWRQVRNG